MVKKLEYYWNAHNEQARKTTGKTANGITIETKREDDQVADIILSKEGMESDYIDGNYNRFSLTPITILDEIHHGITKSYNAEAQEHLDLFAPLMQELNEGVFGPVMGSYYKQQFQEKIEDPSYEKVYE